MKTSYRAVKRTYTDRHLGTYDAYAIEALDEDGNILEILDDFSVNAEEAEDFVALITLEQLSPIHLCEAAQDYVVLHYDCTP